MITQALINLHHCLGFVPQDVPCLTNSLHIFCFALLQLHCKPWQFRNQLKCCYDIPIWQPKKKKESLGVEETSSHSNIQRCSDSMKHLNEALDAGKIHPMRWWHQRLWGMSVLQLFMPIISRSTGAVYLDANTLSSARHITASFFSWSSFLLNQLGCAQ